MFFSFYTQLNCTRFLSFLYCHYISISWNIRVWYHCMNYSIWTISCFVLCCKMFSGYILLSFLFSLNSKLLVNGNSTFHGQLAYHVTSISQWCCNLSLHKHKNVVNVLLKRRRRSKLESLKLELCSHTTKLTTDILGFTYSNLHAIHVNCSNLTSVMDCLSMIHCEWLHQLVVM